jgi:hypothetical protein
MKGYVATLNAIHDAAAEMDDAEEKLAVEGVDL